MTVSLNAELLVWTEFSVVSADVELDVFGQVVQLGFTLPREKDPRGLLRTFFDYESDKYGVYVLAFGISFNYTNLTRILRKERNVKPSFLRNAA